MRDVRELDVIGGDPAIDFVNTLGGLREGPWDDEWLPSYRELAAWGGHAGLLDGRTVRRLLERAEDDPLGAAAAHAEALALRERMYRVMAALAAGGRSAGSRSARESLAAVPPGDLAAVEAAHRDALAHGHLTAALDRFGWTWDDDADLRRPLWPVAVAAVDLLRSDRLARLKRCGNCRWLFLDASKNRSRRWCSMAHCGTEAKVRALRERRRVGRGH